MWRAIALGFALVVLTTAAQADATVTLCNSDDQTGAGTNLSSAISVGGRIVFACGSGATILMNCHHEIIANTEIDGGGTVTLQDNPSGPGCASSLGSIHYALFHDKPAQAFSFQLTGLHIVGVKPPPPAPISLLKGQLVSGNLVLTATNSTITGWTSPIGLSQGLAVLDNSTFSDNDGTVVGAPNLSIRNKSVFANNEGVPLEAQGGTVVIADSQFSGNKRGSNLKQCARIDVRNSRFDFELRPRFRRRVSDGLQHPHLQHRLHQQQGTLRRRALYHRRRRSHQPYRCELQVQCSHGGGAISIRAEIYAPVPPDQAVELHGVTFKSNQAQIGGALDLPVSLSRSSR